MTGPTHARRTVALLCAGALAAVAAPVAAADESLEKCRLAEQDFDYEKVLEECAIAVAEPNNTRDERIEIFSLLGIAHTALGNPQKAEVWFLRLLVLSPTHTLPDTVSPVYREAFANAVEKFKAEGAVVVEHTPAAAAGEGPFPVSFKIVDKLGRVQDARVIVQPILEKGEIAPVEVALTRKDLPEPAEGEEPPAEGTTLYEGEIIDPVPAAKRVPEYDLEYRLLLRNVVGEEVEATPAFAAQRIHIQTRGLDDSDEGGGPNIALWGGVGAVAVLGTGAVLTAGALGAVVVVCAATPTCFAQEPAPPIAFVNVSVAE